MRALIIAAFMLATLALMVEAALLNVNTPRKYVGYKQCNPSWGSEIMGVDGPGERNTICNEGCAMSCVTMVLATLGATTADGQPLNPGTFNSWLIANDGYMCDAGDCNNLNLTAPDRRSSKVTFISEAPKASYDDISAGIARGDIAYVAHVRNKHHFVLLTAPTADKQSFTVNDPGFDQLEYHYDNISDIITYRINE